MCEEINTFYNTPPPLRGHTLLLNVPVLRFEQDRQCTYNVTLRCFCESLFPWKSNKYYIFVCVCVRACVHVALLIQHATRMRHVMASSVTPQVPPYFSTLSHKRRDFLKKGTEYKICSLIFSTTFITNISHSKNNLARYGHKC